MEFRDDGLVESSNDIVSLGSDEGTRIERSAYAAGFRRGEGCRGSSRNANDHTVQGDKCLPGGIHKRR